MANRTKLFLQRIQRSLHELNLFESGLNDVQAVRRERYSTRLYLIFLVVALVVLVIYIGFCINTIHVTVENPALITYEALLLQYPKTLKCPCTQIAVKYGSFFQIKPVYHQVEDDGCRSSIDVSFCISVEVDS